jgi:hypothetical protein
MAPASVPLTVTVRPVSDVERSVDPTAAAQAARHEVATEATRRGERGLEHGMRLTHPFG